MIMSMRSLHETFNGKKTPQPDSPNPYLNARRSWNIHMGHVQQFGALGIFIGVAGLLIGLAAVGDYLHRGASRKLSRWFMNRTRQVTTSA